MAIGGDRLSMLQALLQGGVQRTAPFGQPLPAGVAPTAAQAPMVDREARIRELMSVLSRPEPAPQLPVPQAPNMIQQGIGTLADALGAYAAGISGNNGLQVGALDMLRQRREQRDMAIAANEQAGARSKSEAGRRGAELELGRIMRQQDLEDRARADQGELEAKIKAEAEQQRAKMEADAQELKTRQDFDREMATLRGEQAIAQIREEARLRPAPKTEEDRVALREAEREQRKGAAEVMQLVMETEPALAQALAEGKTTPDAMRKRFIGEMDMRGLEGAERSRALQFFIKHLEPVMRQHTQAEAAKQRGNQPGIGGQVVPLPEGTKKVVGKVKSILSAIGEGASAIGG